MSIGLWVAKAAIVLALAAASVLCGGWLVTRVFRLAERARATELPASDEHGSAAQNAEAIAPLTHAATYLRGGEWIGYLERLAVFGTLLAGFPEGVAVAMVVKSFARYPEIKASSTGAAERFIIGTFVSVLFASAGAAVAMWLIHLF
ncbi:MAG: hypothetical protein IPL41_03335 [Micropruina sp.]|nr:hypothetical protein [Micropruina sp.]